MKFHIKNKIRMHMRVKTKKGIFLPSYIIYSYLIVFQQIPKLQLFETASYLSCFCLILHTKHHFFNVFFKTTFNFLGFLNIFS